MQQEGFLESALAYAKTDHSGLNDKLCDRRCSASFVFGLANDYSSSARTMVAVATPGAAALIISVSVLVLLELGCLGMKFDDLTMPRSGSRHSFWVLVIFFVINETTRLLISNQLQKSVPYFICIHHTWIRYFKCRIGLWKPGGHSSSLNLEIKPMDTQNKWNDLIRWG
jgi:hypothetical protein